MIQAQVIESEKKAKIADEKAADSIRQLEELQASMGRATRNNDELAKQAKVRLFVCLFVFVYLFVCCLLCVCVCVCVCVCFPFISFLNVHTISRFVQKKKKKNVSPHIISSSHTSFHFPLIGLQNSEIRIAELTQSLVEATRTGEALERSLNDLKYSNQKAVSWLFYYLFIYLLFI